MGQDQVSGGVSVLCWLAAPVAMFYGNLSKIGNKVKIGNLTNNKPTTLCFLSDCMGCISCFHFAFTAPENVVLDVDEDYRRIKKQMMSKISKKCKNSAFVDGDVHTHTLGQTTEVTTVDERTSTCSPQLSVCDSSQFSYGTDLITSISITQDDTAWIHKYKSTKNLLVNSSGQVKNEIEQGDCDDFIVLDNGDHVFTGFVTKEIRKVSPTGHVTVVCSTAPLRPRGISMSRDGHMLVCLCDGNISDITVESMGEVQHVDMTGRVVTRYRYGNDGRTKLLTHPKRITQNVNMDLCVVDYIDRDFRSRVVGVTTDSRVKFTYTGQASLKKKFSALDVCCDQHGRIILTDFYNHSIHVLSADGQFLQYLLTAQDGLVYPRSLALRDGTLWVGCSNGVVRVLKLKSAN